MTPTAEKTLRQARAEILSKKLPAELDGYGGKELRKNLGWTRCEVNQAVEDLVAEGLASLDTRRGFLILRKVTVSA